jgi:hypothetical protein
VVSDEPTPLRECVPRFTRNPVAVRWTSVADLAGILRWLEQRQLPYWLVDAQGDKTNASTSLGLPWLALTVDTGDRVAHPLALLRHQWFVAEVPRVNGDPYELTAYDDESFHQSYTVR